MGKSKISKAGENVPQRHLHSRISFLHQAAAYLATNAPTRRKDEQQNTGSENFTTLGGNSPRYDGGYEQSRHLLNQLRGVSKKSQIRLGKDVKHSMCRRCDSLLISGQTSVEEIKNGSKKGAKPWADVFEIKCRTCLTRKRFPVGQQRVQQVTIKEGRQKKKSKHRSKRKDELGVVGKAAGL